MTRVFKVLNSLHVLMNYCDACGELNIHGGVHQLEWRDGATDGKVFADWHCKSCQQGHIRSEDIVERVS